MFGMLEEVSKQQLYLVISFLYRFTSKGWSQVAFSWTKDYLWLLDTVVSEIWWSVHIISFHIINLLTPLLPTPWRSPEQTPPNHESQYFRHPHLLLKSLKSLSLSEKFSSPESIHTSSNTSWAVFYLSTFKIEKEFYFALPTMCFLKAIWQTARESVYVWSINWFS